METNSGHRIHHVQIPTFKSASIACSLEHFHITVPVGPHLLTLLAISVLPGVSWAPAEPSLPSHKGTCSSPCVQTYAEGTQRGCGSSHHVHTQMKFCRMPETELPEQLMTQLRSVGRDASLFSSERQKKDVDKSSFSERSI